MTDNENTKSRRPNDRDPTDLALPRFALPSIFEDFVWPFDSFMAPFLSGSRSLWTEPGAKEPSIDFQDRGDHFVLTAELPGFDKKDVEVDISSNALELKAERSSDKEMKNKEGTRRQNISSYFHRYLTLPEEVLSHKADGTMKNGVLELRLPKRAPKTEERPRRVDLK